MAYRSNLPALSGRMEHARASGLIAAATVLVNAVKLGLRGGYTSGAFVTGNVVGSVTRSEPLVTVAEGSIRVGTNVPYALYWELGHQNLYTRRFERKEVWYPALRDNGEQMRAAYARAVRRALGGA